MQIIDFERKGNVIRFYLGEKTQDWGWTNPDYKDYTGKTPDWLRPSDIYYGDDWNDRPYEHNAGQVYDEFIKGYFDITVPFDDLVLEPCTDQLNSEYCKDDMRNHEIPCIIIVPKSIYDTLGGDWAVSFKDCLNRDDVTKIYFGDDTQSISRYAL